MSRSAVRQDQFLNVISRDDAFCKFHEALRPQPLSAVRVTLHAAHGMILAEEVVSEIDVPAFDRANVDGFAIVSADTFGSLDEHPSQLLLNDEVLATGVFPTIAVQRGTATAIATGGMVPRGADAVVMIEHTETVELSDKPGIEVRRACAPGESVTFAGTDISRGETVAWRGTLLTAREIGVLAAIGRCDVAVVPRPKVAIISTGNEIVPPGEPLPVGCVYDSNAAILASSVHELGGESVVLGVVRDSLDELKIAVQQGLESCDLVVMSGGTSKGAGDISYEVVREFNDPGIVAHGVALKPGKPLCLAVTRGKGVVILPGFPTSAVFTFHEFVAPVIRMLSGREAIGGDNEAAIASQTRRRPTMTAVLPIAVNSDRGRTEYLLVSLVQTPSGWSAYPMGKGSGSVTTFSRADGFITIPATIEMLDAGTEVEVTLIDQQIEPADLNIIGSHCVGLDVIVGRLREWGVSSKVMHVGSLGGLAAARRGECDIAPIHLLDPETDTYNEPFLSGELTLIRGYTRMQAFLFRQGDPRFAGKSIDEAFNAAVTDATCVMVNRNTGSGTRLLIDQLLAEHGADSGNRPPGYGVQPKSHQAVAAAILQGRADWGVAIDTVAQGLELGAIPIRAENYDFAVPIERASREAVLQFQRALDDPKVIARLKSLGLTRHAES